MKEAINNPKHYGGKDNPLEVIKIIEAYKLGFKLGNVIKYILRAENKNNTLEDLKKALWYLDSEIKEIEKSNLLKEFKKPTNETI